MKKSAAFAVVALAVVSFAGPPTVEGSRPNTSTAAFLP